MRACFDAVNDHDNPLSVQGMQCSGQSFVFIFKVNGSQLSIKQPQSRFNVMIFAPGNQVRKSRSKLQNESKI